MREKNLLCPPPTRTLLTLLVAPYYFFITCCIWKLYHTAKQPLFVRRSRTREWSNKRPGASWRAKINVTLGRCAKTTRFFHSPYTSRSSRALRENHTRVPWKKKDFNEKTLTVLKSTTMSTYTRSWYMYTSYNCSTWLAYCTCYLKI